MAAWVRAILNMTPESANFYRPSRYHLVASALQNSPSASNFLAAADQCQSSQQTARKWRRQVRESDGTGGFPAVARSTMKLKGKPEPAESPRRADFQNHHFFPPSNPSTIFFPVKMFPNPAVQVETPPTGRKWHGNFQLFTYRSAAQRVP